MRRIGGDAPGPGQEIAIRIIEVAERITTQGNTVTVRWTPAHEGVEGNEKADEAAKDAATRMPTGSLRGRHSVAFLRRKISEEMKEKWITDTEARMKGREGTRAEGRTEGRNEGKNRGAYRGPNRERGPRIREPLRRARKRTASVFYQMLSGHAMIAPFLKERCGGSIRTNVGGAMEGDKAGSICSRSAPPGRRK